MNPFRKALIGGALVATTLTGGAIGAGLVGTAGAQTSTTTAPAASSQENGTSSQTGPADQTGPRDQNGTNNQNGSSDQNGTNRTPDWSKGGHQADGKTETVLTGDDLAKAKAAAEAAVPGATAQRAETDAEGAAYEVHMTKSDGSVVTVKLDSDFKVTSTIDGMG